MWQKQEDGLMILCSFKNVFTHFKRREAPLRLSHGQGNSSYYLEESEHSLQESQIPVFNMISYICMSPEALLNACLLYETDISVVIHSLHKQR